MKPKILLIGKSGQIGRELNQLLPVLGDLVALDRKQLDLSNPRELRQSIRAIHPNLIINAAAYTAVDGAETDEATARAINSDAPGVMAMEAKAIGAAVIHYSTDYVFDGSNSEPYCEGDPTNPTNAYGRTKLTGEQAIEQTGVPHLIFRTAWVYAQEGKNFLLTILRLATQREELKIVRDQIGAPTWSREIAEATTRVLMQLFDQETGFASLADVSGVYHMTAAGETSWCGFAQAILEEALRSTPHGAWFAAATQERPLIARHIIPIATEEYPTPARRPAYSVLSNNRLANQFGIRLPEWEMQLRSVFLDHSPEHPDLRAKES